MKTINTYIKEAIITSSIILADIASNTFLFLTTGVFSRYIRNNLETIPGAFLIRQEQGVVWYYIICSKKDIKKYLREADIYILDIWGKGSHKVCAINICKDKNVSVSDIPKLIKNPPSYVLKPFEYNSIRNYITDKDEIILFLANKFVDEAIITQDITDADISLYIDITQIHGIKTIDINGKLVTIAKTAGIYTYKNDINFNLLNKVINKYAELITENTRLIVGYDNFGQQLKDQYTYIEFYKSNRYAAEIHILNDDTVEFWMGLGGNKQLTEEEFL